MPRIGQMFPSRYLQPEDLQPARITAVTIERVFPLEAKANDAGDVDTVWAMKLVEFRKPMKLKAIVARTIADALGTDDVDAWPGHRVGIFPIQIVAYGKTMTVINADIVKPPQGPALAAGGGTALGSDRRPIPRVAVDRFLGALKERAATWEDFLRFLKHHVPGGIELAFGVDLDSIPAALVPPMKRYRDGILGGKTAADMLANPAAVEEVIDRSTGEVTTLAAPPGPTTSPMRPIPPAAAPLSEKDIPF